MQPDDHDAGRLWDMLRSAEEVRLLSEGRSFDWFSEERPFQLAILHLIQIVGEASHGVSERFMAAHPEIPWSAMWGMRNVIVHGYQAVNLARVWSVVVLQLPVLIDTIKPLVSPLSEDDTPSN